MKNSILFFVILFSIGFLQAQTFEEYKKQQEEAMKEFAEKQAEGIAKLQQEYAEYVSKRDKEWAEYLKKEWENYQAFATGKMPERPKPKVKPNYTPTEKPVTPTTITPVAPPKETPKVLPPSVEITYKPTEKIGRHITIQSFNFYGRYLEIPFDIKMRGLTFSTVNQDNIAGFWQKASDTDYTVTVEKLLKIKEEMNINDFGYLSITNEFSKRLYPNNENLTRLMTWFLMVRSGYGVRIGYQDRNIALLLPSLQEVYQSSYLQLGGMKYYVYPKLEKGSFYTYKEDYLKTGRQIDFNIYTPINFAGNKVDKKLSVYYDNRNYELDVSYDPDLINFYKNYPLVELSVYFNAAASAQTKESLANAILPIVSTMDEQNAVAFILHFVQIAFEYKTDPEQFGYEKFFFPDELFFYPYSDCEDRSVLFAYLIRETLGLKVVGLEYSDHVAVAVALNSPLKGDYLTYNNTKYYITDPTYINAPIGMSMPKYKSATPTICQVNNKTADDFFLDKQWALAQNSGFYKGSIRKNGKQLSDGNSLLTGFFAGKVSLGGKELVSPADNHSSFVAKLDKNGKALWVNALSAGKDNAVGMSVETLPNGNIVVAGVFTGTIKSEGKTITAAHNRADLFMAGYSQQGKLIWLNQGGLDVLPDSIPTAFSTIFNANGFRESLAHADSEMGELDQGLFVNEKGQIYYNGMTNNALAVVGVEKDVSFASAAEVDVVALLELETKKFVEKQTDKAMAGLLAGIKLVRYMNVSLTGDKIREAINKRDPNFQKTSPNIYKNLGRINFVKNSKGVVTIQTQGGGDISFDKVKISNNSKITITELANNDYKIEVLDGIKVGKLVVWFKLNYIKMFAQKGDLLFDYSTDNSQVTVNVQKDILD